MRTIQTPIPAFKRPSKDEVKAIEVESQRLLKESIKGEADVDFDAENRRILNEYMIGWRGVDRATDSGNEPIAFSQQALSMLIDDALAAQEALLKAFMAAARGAKVKN